MISRRLFVDLGIMQVDKTSEAEPQVSAQDNVKQVEALALTGKSNKKSIMALAVFALGLNASAAVYTMSPSDFALPDVSVVAELLPHLKSSEPAPDPVVAALKDIQATQQQHIALLQQNNSSLQQIQGDSTTLASLRQSITDERGDVKKISAQIADEHVDVKKMSTQLSTLMAKIDSLQNAISPELTSSIPTGNGRSRIYVSKRMSRQSKPMGPVSVGGAPLSVPAVTSPKS
jgi:septal ring factor EnvC (AmiA/AmiB activator)